MMANSPVLISSADASATFSSSIETYLATYYSDKTPYPKADNDENPRHWFRQICQTPQGRYAVFPGKRFVSYCLLSDDLS